MNKQPPFVSEVFSNDSSLESQAREETFCRGCKNPKDKGMVVCWHCWKHRTDITPLKEWGGDLSNWLREFNLS